METKQETNEETSQVQEFWKILLSRVQHEIPPSIFNSIISSLKPISLENDTLSIGAPNSFTRDLIESRYSGLLGRVASESHGTNITIVVSVIQRTQENEAKENPPLSAASTNYSETDVPPRPTSAGITFPQKKYTFENFVVGDSNKFAYNAALMVAEVPGHTYNPLFIYGGTGLGKTHLLLAIKDYAERLSPNTKVRYVRTSEFIDEFVATLTLKRDMVTFDQKYINNKIVLFDDIQALSGTDATQNKFFDLFNLLYGSNSHIVLSSDRPPREMARLSDRIQSRFEGGLIIDIKPPDLETRLAILRLKSRAEKVEVPDDVLIFIASKVKENIRSLEGLLNRVVAYARLYGTKIDLPMVQELLKDQVAEPDQAKTPTIEVIQNMVSNYYNIPRADLTGKSRSKPLVHGRQIAMYLCRELTNETLISIGSSFGGRDHATVLHSCRKIEAMIKERRDTLQEVRELTNMINKSI